MFNVDGVGFYQFICSKHHLFFEDTTTKCNPKFNAEVTMKCPYCGASATWFNYVDAYGFGEVSIEQIDVDYFLIPNKEKCEEEGALFFGPLYIGDDCNHYTWLERYFPQFAESIGIEPGRYEGAICADGDKCYQYKNRWKSKGIEFPKGIAIYLITKFSPWSETVRKTKDGWVDPCDWVITNKDRFLPILDSLEKHILQSRGA